MKLGFYERFSTRVNVFITENFRYVVLLMLFNSTYLFQDYYVQAKYLMVWDGLFFILLHGIKLFAESCAWIAVLGKINKYLRDCLIMLSGVLFFCDSFTLVQYHSVIDQAMIQAILGTNPTELIEYLQTHEIIGLTVFSGVCIAVLFLKKFMLLIERTGTIWIKIIPRSLPLLTVLGIVSFPLLMIVDLELPQCIAAGRIICDIPAAVREMNEYQHIYQNMSMQPVGITSNESTIPDVVFILGESTSRNHMGIYGYYLQTTPLQAMRRDADELKIFQDVVSPHAQTQLVLKELFTFCRRDSDKAWYQYMNLFDLLNASGYRTVWLSNQDSSGVYGNLGRAYADRCSEKNFVSIHDSDNPVESYDEKLLPALDQAIQGSAEKNFYVVHLMGAHQNYKKRYPREYAIFTEADEIGNTAKEKQWKAEYDNAVLYNDFVINEIIKRFENHNAIVVFVPDHGENAGDDGQSFGHNEGGNICEIEIPMEIWTSKKFRENYKEKEAAIAFATERPFMTDDMIHVLLDLLDIKVPDFDKTKSIINGSFDETQKRMYHNVEYSRQH